MKTLAWILGIVIIVLAAWYFLVPRTATAPTSPIQSSANVAP